MLLASAHLFLLSLVLSISTDTLLASNHLYFSCVKDNDLFLALKDISKSRFDSAAAAIRSAPKESAVLLLADDYPIRTVALDSASVELARKKQLHLYIEFPASLPDIDVGPARHATWERVVVSSDRLAPALPRLHVLAAQDCHFVTLAAEEPDLVIARVAGYDRAVFGLPEKDVFPILFKSAITGWTVATTKLSCFKTARYAPTQDWKQLWEKILSGLAPGSSEHVIFDPVERPALAPTAFLPRNYQKQAFDTAAHWFGHSHLLVHPSEKESIYETLSANSETTAAANPTAPEGNGSLGILEGYASGILTDGTQPRRLPLRADCNAESAMVLALDAALNRNRTNAEIAANLLDFVYFNSGICRGVRDDTNSAAYGLIGWGDLSPSWLTANYGDDNARTLLATALAGVSLKTNRWNERVMRALLANLRTTGKLGFRGDRIDLPALAAKGWKSFHDAEIVNYSPHFESYLWACYLWAYQQTRLDEFLNRARTGISMTMQAYPAKWRWQNNLERAHMLLSLAWLLRIENTPEHRAWLDQVTSDLLKCSRRGKEADASYTPSGAIYEVVSTNTGGHYRVPMRNEDYGTTETPLIQENGDPVSDQLYTAGFALLGLHEAASATGDPIFKNAEDKLAQFLCRIQTRSEKYPWLNGTWFRAFDDQRWETWASSADVGWGAWSIEAGWGQAWTTAVLALREQHISLWETICRADIDQSFPSLKQQLLGQ